MSVLTGKQWTAGEALGASHRTDHNAISQILAGSGVSALAYGAGTAESGATNTAAIQAALAAESIVVVPEGTFELAVAGANPYDASNKYCLDFPSNTTLILAPGAVLQLADGQQTDAGGAVDIIVGQSVSNVTITGKGKILGNTAGQTGWTGGYSQTASGCIIIFHGGCSDITIEGVTLGDHWSNPVLVENIGGAGTNRRVRLSGLYCYDVGEGLLIASTDESWVDHCTVADVSDVMVGDGIEWSDCTNFSSTGCRLLGEGAGSGFDIFGSSEGSVTNFVCDGWRVGFDVNEGLSASSTNVAVSGGVIYAPTFGGMIIRGTSVAGVSVDNVKVVDSADFGFDLSGSGPLLLEGCSAEGCVNGVEVAAIDGLTISGGSYSRNSAAGITWDGIPGASTSADIKDLAIVGVTAASNGTYGVYLAATATGLTENANSAAVTLGGDASLVAEAGDTLAVAPTGGVLGCVLTGNGTAGYTAENNVDAGMTVSGNAT